MKKLFLIISLLYSKMIVAQGPASLNIGNNKVGINTNNPNYELHINKNGAVGSNIQLSNNATGQTANDGLLLGITDTGDAQIHQQSLFNLGFYLNQKKRFEIVKSNISNSSNMVFDDGNLEINSILSFENKIISNGTSTLFLQSSKDVTNNSFLAIQSLQLDESGTLNGLPKERMNVLTCGNDVLNMLFRFNSNGRFHFAGTTNSIPTMTINVSNKNVGIGTTFPSHTLQVEGDLKLGILGNTTKAIAHFTRDIDLPNINGGGSYTVTFNDLNSIGPGNHTVVANIDTRLSTNLFICQAFVSGLNTVELKFLNFGPAIDLEQVLVSFTVFTF